MAGLRTSTKTNDMFAKKIPQNPRYKHVKSTLNTGASVTNYMKKLDEMRKNYRYRKDEIFKRMKVSTFAQLVLQVAEVVNMEFERLQLETARLDDENVEEQPETYIEQSQNGSTSERLLLEQVIAGTGEMDVREQNNNTKGTGDSRVAVGVEPEERQSVIVPEPTSLPYLLLDVRDKDEYNECHIIGALSYPAPMLTRSVNYLSKEMLEFKNKPGKIIIVYDDDERLATNVATVLIQREIDNVIMLSGGMKVLHKKFPGCFMSGKLPVTCFSPQADRKGKPKPFPTVTENEHVEWYDCELLEKIQDSLDEVLLGNETSRNSARSTVSRSTNQSSRISTASTAKSIGRSKK